MPVEKRTYGQWWDTTEELVRVPVDRVLEIGIAALKSGGATEENAAFIMDQSLMKALQGDHTRGLGRLPGTVQAAKNGALDLNPEVKVLRESSATALVGAGPNAQSSIVCRFAMDLAIEKARQHGVGWVGAHALGGILTQFVKQAVDAGMIGMVMTQSFPSVAPLGGMKPLLGNAPIAFGIPAGKHAPVILDLSMTESSASGMFQTAKQGGQAPEGALLDERGNPTRDAREFVTEGSLGGMDMVARGSLSALGGGHKGYALVFIVGLLSYILTDTSPPWDLRKDIEPPGQVGTFFVAIDPARFTPAEEVASRVDSFIDTVKSQPKKAGAVDILYPGERSQQFQREGLERGTVDIPASHYQGLASLAKELGMEGTI